MTTAVAAPRPVRDEDELLSGLRAARKRLPCRLLLEAPELFDRVLALEDYYPARVEHALLHRHASQIASQVGASPRVIEPGGAHGLSTRRLLSALERPTNYVPIDLSPLHGYAALPGVEVQPVVADYLQPFELPVPQHEWLRTLVFLPGSMIGTLEPGEARGFLAMLGRIAGPDRLLLLGADATREPELLVRAYDDADGANAELARHVLTELDRTRGGTFDPDAFTYRAVWNGDASRIERQLVSKTQQIVRLAGTTIALAPGEPIVLEHDYKHTPAAMQALLGAAGWRPRQVFTATEVPFRLWLCEPLR